MPANEAQEHMRATSGAASAPCCWQPGAYHGHTYLVSRLWFLFWYSQLDTQYMDLIFKGQAPHPVWKLETL